MQRLEGLKFLFVTGKGGVGKSTVAAGLAARLAADGKRVLLVFPSGSLGQDRLLGRSVEQEPAEILPGFFAMAIDPDTSMREYAESVLHSKKLTAALFHNKVAQGFLRGIPGLRAWAFLGKSWYFAEPEVSSPTLRTEAYDVVIVDAPATGDGTDMLRVPRVILELAPRGRLRRDAEACWEMLQDPGRSAVLPVTLLEELPVAETEELVELVRRDLGVAVGPVIANLAQPELFDPADRRRLADLRSDTEPGLSNPPPAEVEQSESSSASGEPQSPAARVIDLASRRALSEVRALACRQRVDGLGLGRLDVPRMPEEPTGAAGLSALAQALAQPA